MIARGVDPNRARSGGSMEWNEQPPCRTEPVREYDCLRRKGVIRRTTTESPLLGPNRAFDLAGLAGRTCSKCVI